MPPLATTGSELDRALLPVADSPPPDNSFWCSATNVSCKLSWQKIKAVLAVTNPVSNATANGALYLLSIDKAPTHLGIPRYEDSGFIDHLHEYKWQDWGPFFIIFLCSVCLIYSTAVRQYKEINMFTSQANSRCSDIFAFISALFKAFVSAFSMFAFILDYSKQLLAPANWLVPAIFSVCGFFGNGIYQLCFLSSSPPPFFSSKNTKSAVVSSFSKAITDMFLIFNQVNNSWHGMLPKVIPKRINLCQTLNAKVLMVALSFISFFFAYICGRSSYYRIAESLTIQRDQAIDSAERCKKCLHATEDIFRIVACFWKTLSSSSSLLLLLITACNTFPDESKSRNISYGVAGVVVFFSTIATFEYNILQLGPDKRDVRQEESRESSEEENPYAPSA